ncbi:succinate CoA transferase [Entomobacter blattae]|uniref:Succinyl-CoA:acetate CoA-transferase n=1 Tax=Entomobacter blattae TaxID=2762277 RepID=A0A7H1NNJ3_9PROT|nr:succinate CoA transferase [Entomobacter blattae]QNT77353.1 Succinyl-CoA:acetate CoA-transferase [Entomobacter blattae]
MEGIKRVGYKPFQAKICSAEEAALHIQHNDLVGMSGFTGSGYPKDIPQALAQNAQRLHTEGRPFSIRLVTGASTGPELDGSLAQAQAVSFRSPYNSEKAMRALINAGQVAYVDGHLSRTGDSVDAAIWGEMDVAVIEVSAITEDGALIPSSSVGNNQTWLDNAKTVLLEVNSWQSADFLGFHDIYRHEGQGAFQPIPLTEVNGRVGKNTFWVDPQKVKGVVLTHTPDRNADFSAPDDAAEKIAGYLLDFYSHEVKKGRLPPSLFPLQSGVGNIANAVLAGLKKGPFRNLQGFTEVIQDGMLELLDEGVMEKVSATAFSLSPAQAAAFNTHAQRYQGRVILRPQAISNHAELIRRFHIIAMNGLLEADIYGNVNSTHVMGSAIQNGIGGSGDFARNALLSVFMTPSIAKGGKISTIVPAVPHVDHIAQDVHVVVTEQGLADLRGLSPVQRAQKIIAICAHPLYRPMLEEYFQHAQKQSFSFHKPVLLPQAFSWHQRFIETGSMLVSS